MLIFSHPSVSISATPGLKTSSFQILFVPIFEAVVLIVVIMLGFSVLVFLAALLGL